jgi:hypothetical protein
VQDAEEADLGAEMFRIGCNGLESFGRSPEQQTVHLSLVLQGEWHKWFGQSEDNMKIFARQQLSLALFQPLGSSHRLTFWAMPIRTGVVCVPFVSALVTPFEMASQCGGPAAFDRTQHALLRRGQRGSMRLAKLVAMGAHNISDFESRPHKQRAA